MSYEQTIYARCTRESIRRDNLNEGGVGGGGGDGGGGGGSGDQIGVFIQLTNRPPFRIGAKQALVIHGGHVSIQVEVGTDNDDYTFPTVINDASL
jgi:hypothetical protein